MPATSSGCGIEFVKSLPRRRSLGCSSGFVIRLRKGIDLGQRGRRLAHVELASDDIGDQAGAVFAEKRNLPVSMIG